MLEQAKSKLKTEMDGNKNNLYIQVVGQFLLDHLNSNPGAAGKILAEGKTIAKSLDDMKAEARKHQVNGCGVLPDQEGFAVVLKYFDVAGTTTAAPTPVTVTAPASAQTTGFDIKLEDLL